MVQMIGHVTNCTFFHHRHGALRVNNGLDSIQAESYRSLPVDYVIRYSRFVDNTGPNVVDLRLTELSERQRLQLAYNVFSGNRVKRTLPWLHPRSAMPAVIVVGSSQVAVVRNDLWNPGSDYEIASHLSASDKHINTTLNFWGDLFAWNSTEWGAVHRAVSKRIFDQNHRYTLARCDYYPVLKDPDLASQFATTGEPPFVPGFIALDSRTGMIELGGRLAVERGRQVTLEPLFGEVNFYHVTKDIFIPPGGILTIKPGVRMYFDNGVGLFSQGELRLQGSASLPITLDLFRPANSEVQWPDFPSFMNGTDDPMIKLSNQTTIRLVGGSWLADTYTGRVEVRPSQTEDGINTRRSIPMNTSLWGTVCEKGFTEYAAMLVCSAIGLVAHPKNWYPKSSVRQSIRESADRWFNSSEAPIHIANLKCHGYETDLFECRHDGPDEHSCTHQDDLVIRCHRPRWAGVRVTISDMGSRTPVQHVRLRRAGLLDYTRLILMPGLQLDYHSAAVENIEVQQCLSDGLLVIHGDPLLGIAVSNSRFMDNAGSGIRVQTPWLTMRHCHLAGNRGPAGVYYDPAISPEQTAQLYAGLVSTLPLFGPIEHPDRRVLTPLMDDWTLAVIYRTELAADDRHRMHQIVLHLLDYPVTTAPTSNAQSSGSPKATIGPRVTPSSILSGPSFGYTQKQNQTDTIEELIIYDSALADLDPLRVYSWRIPRDLTRLPLISSTNRLTLEFRVQGIASGRLLLAAQTKDFQHAPDLRQWSSAASLSHRALFGFEPDTRYPLIPEFRMEDSVVEGNLDGVRLEHYNNPVDHENRQLIRHTAELYSLVNVSFSHNARSAVHIRSWTKFVYDWDLLFTEPTHLQSVERLSFIGYNLTKCRFWRNRGTVLQSEHGQLPFSNNLWSYRVDGCVVEQNELSNGTDEDAAPLRNRYGLLFQLPHLQSRYDLPSPTSGLHKLVLESNLFRDNYPFQVVIDGYHTQVDMSRNVFQDNLCTVRSEGSNTRSGLLRTDGMEKRLTLVDNRFVRNKDCSFVAHFQGSGQISQSWTVFSYAKQNVFQDNQCTNDATVAQVQKMEWPWTADNNHQIGMRYELIASVHSIQLPSVFDARENFWGSVDPSEIRLRIFHFEDWNCLSQVDVNPPLANDQIHNPSTLNIDSKLPNPSELARHGVLGGQVTGNLHLSYRTEPYRFCFSPTHLHDYVYDKIKKQSVNMIREFSKIGKHDGRADI
ncbi:unnamed protein product [Echinostoma caproni]|uniref:SRCR domain-containing protein n=1 Tax=Echinostoma caproni TaxID=27848 RepID=A0A183AHU7_9TREM|nr:unnamed protein product [Echinostoma caproni]